MTSTIERPDTVTVEPETEAAPPVTVVVGSGVIEAASEEEALRKYKRLVRAEALKTQKEMGWCDSGTNERLSKLGLRLRGDGFPVRMTVTATRTAYFTLDADSKDEALAIAAEQGPDVLELAAASIGGGWTVTGLELPDQDVVRIYAVGDIDDFTVPGAVPRCSVSDRQGYMCTMPRGHGGAQHLAGYGQGDRVAAVWDNTND